MLKRCRAIPLRESCLPKNSSSLGRLLRGSRLLQELDERLDSLQTAVVRTGDDAVNRRVQLAQVDSQLPGLLDAMGCQGRIGSNACR